MKKENDDIKKLFLSFGAEADNFKELTRAADANQAESRWPLLSSVHPGKRALPPLLSGAEKSHSWCAPEPHAQRATPSHASTGLGEKLASSLRQQLQAKPAQPVVAEAALPPVQPVLSRAQETPKSLFSFAVGKDVRTGVAPPDDELSSVFKRIGKPAAEPLPAPRKGLLGRLGRA